MNEMLNLAHAAALKAGEIAVKVRSSDNLGLNMKGEVDLCTQADVDAEKIIIETIHACFPEHTILSEESNSSLEDRDFYGPLWIIDPIDGTTNFAHGHSHFAVSIAYADKGIVQAGIVYSPFQNETFTAIKGKGAYLNGNLISVGECDSLKSALVATGFPYDRSNLEPIIKRIRAILQNCRDIRRNGAASLDICWVACGKLDAYYENVCPWDMAAACLIAKEAGAVVGHFSATPKVLPLPEDLYPTDLVVANKVLIEKLLEIIT